jgi:hypothetical protein
LWIACKSLMCIRCFWYVVNWSNYPPFFFNITRHLATQCASCKSHKKTLYNPKKSKTYKKDGRHWSIAYGKLQKRKKAMTI